MLLQLQKLDLPTRSAVSAGALDQDHLEWHAPALLRKSIKEGMLLGSALEPNFGDDTAARGSDCTKETSKDAHVLVDHLAKDDLRARKVEGVQSESYSSSIEIW